MTNGHPIAYEGSMWFDMKKAWGMGHGAQGTELRARSMGHGAQVNYELRMTNDE